MRVGSSCAHLSDVLQQLHALHAILKLNHCGCFIKQTKLNATQQMFKVKNTFKRKDTPHSICWLCAFVQPFERFLSVELNRCGYCKWVVSPDFLDKFTITGGTGIGNYYKIERPLFYFRVFEV